MKPLTAMLLGASAVFAGTQLSKAFDEHNNIQLNTIERTIQMKVKVKKLHPQAVIPRYAKPNDAGLDLTVTTAERDRANPMKWNVGFGLAFEIPEGFVGLVFPRSSVHKTQCRLSNAVGVIDAGYRGEVRAVFDTFPTSDEVYNVGDRAAQIIIMPYPQVELEEAEELSSTERGTGGFGSTGKSSDTADENLVWEKI